ncbi:hypothetical protein [Autumnicola edwardsiae]|uniref:Uncharacterized protein n=1 Tax=Autumnicola edwardsiae TaxID=3075594 RepID=A0ABU3CXV8_9FLAO|nr:hypothetical protein [Zunongwangia sp. F297]MDT0651203.1 hypothetical protein [Zunongwangia sp. F297]
MNKYPTHTIASKTGSTNIFGLSFFILGLLMVWGQNSSFLLNEEADFNYQKNALFSQDSEDSGFPLFHLTLETSEEEVSQDSNPKDSYRDFSYPTSSGSDSHLVRIQNNLSHNQASCVDLEVHNRSRISFIILYHCWKGFIS